eukprot:TCONS_00021559-protein
MIKRLLFSKATLGILLCSCLLLGLAYFQPDVRHSIQNLQKRLWMGSTVKTKLHLRDTIFKHAAVATDNKKCSKIGSQILKDGGSAVDSAIASMLCLGVMNPHSTGIGGGGFMLIYMKEKKEARVIDFRESAPSKAHENLFKGNPENGIRGGLSVGIPGELRGMQYAHELYGKLPWKKLFQPAIKLCNEGYKITESLGIALDKWKDDVINESCLRNQYIQKGKALKAGDTVYNKALGKTLSILAEAGNADPFYNGELTSTIVKEIKAQGGIISKKDLKNYEAISREPLVTKLGEDTVVTSPPPASGPILAYILNILKGYKMDESDNVKDPSLIYHRFIEAFKFAYARRTELADPDHAEGIDDIVLELMNTTYAESTRQKIDDERTHKPSYYEVKNSDKVTTGTTHLVVIGPHGDAVTVMSTVNGYLGAKFRSCKLGFIYNNEMDDFSTPGLANEFGLPPSEVNFIQPNKRPLSSSAPTLILDKEFNVKLAIGGSGGSIITTAVAQVIMNNLWFGMSIRDAIQQPRIHAQWVPDNVFAETRMPNETVNALQKKGHNMTVTDGSHAVVQAITRVSKQWKRICQKSKIAGSAFKTFCRNYLKNQVGFFAESDYRKGGEPDGF